MTSCLLNEWSRSEPTWAPAIFDSQNHFDVRGGGAQRVSAHLHNRCKNGGTEGVTVPSFHIKRWERSRFINKSSDVRERRTIRDQ